MENFTMLQYFEWYYPSDGSLWNKFSREAKWLKEIGIDSIWFPPAHKGMAGGNSTGYDSYDLYDLGEFDQKGSVRTKYGTKEEFISAVKSGQAAGINIYCDIVLNHLGGGEVTERILVRKVDPDNRNEFISDSYEIEAFTSFTYPGRAGVYSDFKWDYQCFSGIDYDALNDETAIFSIQNQYGEGWEDVADEEHGNYDYLMLSDIEFRNPHVRTELKRWGEWYYETVGMNGFRLDAIKHIVPDFFNEWLDHLRNKYQKEFFTVGEYWAPYNLQSILNYVALTDRRMSLFDAPLQANFYKASIEGKGYNLSTILENTLVQHFPELAVTLVENHDTQPLQSLEQTVQSWFRPLAYALILLREGGYPCVFYSDLFGAEYIDKDTEGNDQQITMLKMDSLEKMLYARKNLAYGEQVDYFDHENCVGWVRNGDEEHEESGCAVLLSNSEDGFKRMHVGMAHSGGIFIDFLENIKEEIMVDEEGWADFRVNAGSVSIWKRK